VWSLELAATPAWQQLSPSGTPPSPRFYSAGVYDPVRTRMVVIAGAYSGFERPADNQTWALSLLGGPTWELLQVPERPLNPRSGHTAVYDPAHDQAIVFGGFMNVLGSFGDTWALNWGTPTGVWEHLGSRPSVVELDSPKPNPFSNSLEIGFLLRSSGRARCQIFDLSGRRVRSLLDVTLPEGPHQTRWGGENDAGAPLPSGVYFLRLEAEGQSLAKKVVLLR
jgi:hypothetical protein